MPRWARLVAPHFPMHITQRGHNRDLTFHDAHDFASFRELLLQASVRTGCSIHAYALMSNHIHLLLTPPNSTAPSRLMQHACSQYVRYWNKRHSRSGTLWNGRFRSSIVDTDRYFLACSRYIDLNPVRAGLVREAQDYEWSSHRHLAYGVTDRVLTMHGTYQALGESPALRQGAYLSYCAEDRSTREVHDIRSAIRGGAAVGGRRFVARIEVLLQRPATRRAHGGDRKGDGWHAAIS